MYEPLDPIAAGVASVLKTLRTRAGLREDRLAGIELALDTLTGLSSVQEFVDRGDTVERAVVRAVSAAAGTLEPTHSIVVDVSLRLELSADLLPNPDLYSADLGRRRTALLENWERLHELRSAPPPGRAPTMRALRLEVETAALSDLAKALTEAERRRGTLDPAARPAPPGSGAPAAAPGAPAARQPAGDGRPPAPRRPARAPAPLLLDEFRRIARVLRASLLVDDNGPGWPQDLRKGSKPTTTLSTAFGLKAMLLLEGSLTPDLRPAAERLRNPSHPKGPGYMARAQKEPRPEATAAVVSTLHLLDGTAAYDTQLAAIRNGLGEFEKTRPFVLTTVLDTSVQVGSDPELTGLLVNDLLAARRPFGNLLLWPEKAEVDLVDPVPSIAHTARAVQALMQVARGGDEGDPRYVEARQAAEQAAGWLLEQQDLGQVSEVIDRQVAGDVEQDYVRHFTAAWVVKALVSVGLPASHPAVSGAVARIWRDYSTDAALWSWTNGDLPVWMTLDAIDALRLAALAAAIRPGGFNAA